ncbi:transcriptional regulator, AsnC family [Mucilaginibacter frigoritolerans]|uniref:Transcriptional regulator, AsnC family n=1 Tax=Mucilaginibacter frigoritolerans TaxID=652788 RepID=A0A562UCA2_9SPHI|nr:Lrp/AsnC family transcriptional regulator [Mucilaginibacter frigoritolerans]TWJ03179.1 transcriptional regulator, AsnC family [Mucilaginibacter frigoritolerans]
MQELDEYDKKLLRQLQQNNKTTAEELGLLVSLSTSAVQRRLKRLRDDKMIEADVSIISPLAVGIGITCVVDVILEVGSSKAIDNFKAAMQACTEVMQCYYVTGTYDFVLIVNTVDMRHYEEFSKRFLMDNPNVKHFYTHVVMDKVKVGYGINI